MAFSSVLLVPAQDSGTSPLLACEAPVGFSASGRMDMGARVGVVLDSSGKCGRFGYLSRPTYPSRPAPRFQRAALLLQRSMRCGCPGVWLCEAKGVACPSTRALFCRCRRFPISGFWVRSGHNCIGKDTWPCHPGQRSSVGINTHALGCIWEVPTASFML